MKIIMAGSLESFVANVKNLCKVGYKPELLILPKEKDVKALRKELDCYGIETRETDNIHSLANGIKKIEPDLLICIAYPEILRSSIFSIPKQGTINLHTSKLPEYKGRHPVNWALINGEKEIGITAHFISKDIDSGDIILQDTVKVEREDDLNSINKRLTACGMELLLAAVKQIESNSVYRRKQIPDFATYLPRRTPLDSKIDWTKNSFRLTQFINALVAPMPNAFAFKNKRKIFFKRAYRGNKTGEVIGVTDDNKYVISTVDGIILVKTDKKIKKGDILF